MIRYRYNNIDIYRFYEIKYLQLYNNFTILHDYYLENILNIKNNKYRYIDNI